MKRLCKLSELSIGEKGIVSSIDIQNKEIRRHLLDMGITRGTTVEIKKIAPMGNPIDIKLRDYELCIRKEDLEQIKVEVI